ncbi:MAG: DUF1194 domain-containing protein [Pseudomonadota bacterium]
MAALAAMVLIAFRPAQAETVDLELVLAADGSGSIDEAEFKLQRAGYARAISHPLVLGAIKGGEHQKIAVAFIEWGAPTSVETIVGWMVINDKRSASAFAARLVKAPRKVFGYNSISAAIAYATEMIQSNRFQGKRKIIDVSGDGPQINGPPLALVRAKTLAAGITINGLAIKTRSGNYRGPFGAPLEVHYGRDVIGGPGAFVMVADEKTSFAEVVLRKLVREVASAGARRPLRPLEIR